MKRFLFASLVVIAGLSLSAQDHGKCIELYGAGTTGLEKASIAILDQTNVDYIEVKAIYKSTTKPGEIRFSTDKKVISAFPKAIPVSGAQDNGVYTSVYTARFSDPAEMINMDILENNPDIHSFTVYVHRSDNKACSMLAGELYHVCHNDGIARMTEIAVPVSDNPRDISLCFSVTDWCDDDDHMALVTFESQGVPVKMEIKTWKSPEGPDSYVYQNMLFEDIPGEVDAVTFTMMTSESGHDSFVAGEVILNMPGDELSSAL
jgi:hypothetical protein